MLDPLRRDLWQRCRYSRFGIHRGGFAGLVLLIARRLLIFGERQLW